jgi:excinuclease ABC subunit A
MIAVFKQHANRQVREELNILLQKGFSRMYNLSQPSPIREGAEMDSLSPRGGGEIIRIEDLLEMNDEDLQKRISSPSTSAVSRQLLFLLTVL